MKGTLPFLFIFLFLIPVGMCLQIGISKDELNLSGQPNQWLCDKFVISSRDYHGPIAVYNVWSNETKERNLVLHKKTAEELGLEIRYDDNIILNGSKEIEVCVKSIEPGFYHGAIVFRPNLTQGNVGMGMGIWVSLDTEQSGTGTAQGGYELYLIGFLILAALAVLILKRRKK